MSDNTPTTNAKQLVPIIGSSYIDQRSTPPDNTAAPGSGPTRAELCRQAILFVDYLDDHGELSADHHPDNIAAAALHAAGMVLQVDTTQVAVARCFSTSRTGLQLHYYTIRDGLIDQLSSTGSFDVDSRYLIEGASLVDFYLECANSNEDIDIDTQAVSDLIQQASQQ